MQLTTGYSFSNGETNVTHTKLNNAVNNAACVAGSIATADLADDAVTATKINANLAGKGLAQNVDKTLEIVGYGVGAVALTNANVALTRGTSKANQVFTGTLTGAVVINLTRTNAIDGDEFDLLINSVVTDPTNTLTIQENGSGSLLVYNATATVLQAVRVKFKSTAWIVYSVTTVGSPGTVTSVDASGGVETVSGSAISATGTIRGAHAVNAQTGTSYTYLTGDRGKLVTHTNGSAIAGTLPQASASFPANWYMDVQNRGAGTLTITPTTSTIDGAASLALTTGQGCRIFSDGTNYFTMRGVSGSSILPTGFTSTAQTLTASTLTQVAHGLGSIPRFVSVYGKCTSTDQGWAVNDLVQIAPNGATNQGWTLSKDATNVEIRVNLSITIKTKGSTYTDGNMDLSKWSFFIDAWL